MLELSKIKFIDKNDIIEEIEDGHSGAYIYKIIRNGNIFFLKIFNEKFENKKIEKLKMYVEIYEKLKINSLEIIDYGEIENLNKYYVVYNFINGENLKVYTNSEEFTLEDVRNIGIKIGKELLKLKLYKDYDDNNFEYQNIDLLTKKVIDNFYIMLKDDSVRNIIFENFNMKEIDLLAEKLNEYIVLFEDVEKSLIHGDIKRSNIMIDEQGELYIVDIESMQINYDILNLKHQVTWCLFNGRGKENEFIRGYFDGIYNFSRPKNFNKQVVFMIIINFFNASYSFYRKGKLQEFSEYVKNCKVLLTEIGKIDFDNEFIL